MLTFLWLDENDRSTIHLFQLVHNSGKCNASDDKSVRYYNHDDWPATSNSVNERGNDKKIVNIHGENYDKVNLI